MAKETPVSKRRKAAKPAKEQVRDILRQAPDFASLEEIQYRIYVRQKIRNGLEAAEKGRLLSQEEVERWTARWLEPTSTA